MSTGHKLIEAFTILDKYDGMTYGLCAMHNIILTQVKPEDLSDNDRKRLKEQLKKQKEEE